ncbi:arylesterase [Pelovirga terrestris]|uniref:Arylesterase n=1 Tax=Pelovirga terrestris TaxID=2771352 RepID=A0A8J6R5Y8_9BACT|nr:arylesterase [Pelovirga terrestris]MBD1400794.1 arylesterase [Pelovirga terrestris]
MKTPVSWLLLLSLSVPFTLAAAAPMTILVLGDSLTAGYGLAESEAFPAQLETALGSQGHQVRVINAGISGDTSAGGAARLEWSLADNPDLVILALGANDALRGLSPDQTRTNLAAIITRLQERQIRVLLAGMLAPRNMGENYYNSFDKIYPELAQEFDVPLYPFFLEGVAGKPELNLADGIHPNVAGVQVMVEGILPLVVEELSSL